MSNILGKNITLTLFGESHGSAIGAVLDGMPCGIEVDESFIADALSRRRPRGSGETARREAESHFVQCPHHIHEPLSPIVFEIVHAFPNCVVHHLG